MMPTRSFWVLMGSGRRVEVEELLRLGLLVTEGGVQHKEMEEDGGLKLRHGREGG